MARTVRFRPDQPLFKADAFRMPLWLHASGEIVRGFYKWLTVRLNRDNPHRDPMKNATFTKRAKLPHGIGFWTGRPLVKRAKWQTMAWRWGLVFTVLAFVKYLPWPAWRWVLGRLGDMLKWIGLDVIPWCWAHWLWLPVILVGSIAGVYGTSWAFKRLVVRLHGRADAMVPWYEYVIAAEMWVKGRLGR